MANLGKALANLGTSFANFGEVLASPGEAFAGHGIAFAGLRGGITVRGRAFAGWGFDVCWVRFPKHIPNFSMTSRRQ